MKYIDKKIFKGLCICLLCLSAVIAPPAGTLEAGTVIDRIVAVVNDDIVSLYELNQELALYTDKIEALNYSSEKKAAMVRQISERILQQMIERKLTEQKTKELGIHIEQKEIDETIEQVKKAGGYSDETFRRLLEKDGISMENYRERIREQLLKKELVRREVQAKTVVTQDDIKAYYENHKDDFKGKNKYHLKNILIRVSPLASSQEKARRLKRILAIRERLASGASFEAMAEQYSESNNAKDGGDIGLFDFDGLSPEIQKAIQGIEQGGITQVVETDQGYQIFYIHKLVKTEGRTLEEASAEISELLQKNIINQRYREWAEQLIKESHVKILLPAFSTMSMIPAE